jgi:RNA polymerase sigma-70 factor (ECF subfamily)
MTELSEGELVRLIARIARGDAVAFRAFYDATVDRCYRLALSLLSASAPAEDCVSEAYAQVWRSAGSYDVERASPLAWLTMICRSRAIDLLRREQARSAALRDVASDESSAEMMLEGDDNADAWLGTTPVRAALSRLGVAERRLVSLAFVHDLSHAEIAESTGLPLGTVKSRLRRALQTLRQELVPDEAPAQS